jgi:hypothetical protein
MLPLQTGADPIVKKINESTLVEALTRVTALFASGKLSGLTVLDKGDDSGGAWVLVGINEKTINAARESRTK